MAGGFPGSCWRWSLSTARRTDYKSSRTGRATSASGGQGTAWRSRRRRRRKEQEHWTTTMTKTTEYGHLYLDEAAAAATADEEPRGRRRALLEALPLEDYLREKLVDWTEKINGGGGDKIGVPSIAIVAPPEDTDAVAGALDIAASLASRFEAMACVDIPAMHPSHRLLEQPLDILLYMLLKIVEFEYGGFSAEVSKEEQDIRQYYFRKKQYLVDELTKTIIDMNVRTRIEKIKGRIKDIDKQVGLDMEGQSPSTQSLRLLLVALRLSPLYDWWGRIILNQGEVRDKARSVSGISDEEEIIKKTAQELGDLFGGYALCLHHAQYERILREVFPSASSSNSAGLLPQTGAGGEEDDNKIPLDMGKLGAQLTEKMDEIAKKIEEQLEIKWAVDRIEELVRTKRTLLILHNDQNYARRWEETRNALSLVRCAAGSAMMVITTKSTQKATQDFCYPPHKPIVYSLADLYQYHDIVLKLIRQRQQHENDEGGNYNPQIFRDILEKCQPHEFCMKMFAHALYANPNRRYQELRMLHGAPVSQTTLGRNAEKMFMFSYKDLPKEYKSCLLYLAIFPQGQSIRRSTLVGRWITEGLIDNEDWPSAVCQAELCFDGLIDRWFVSPVEIGAAGKVKSCMVASQVHKFISKLAKEEHIMETRL
ncbi:hypothetical protein PVAP13_2KG276701 [Panicum virgatum]|uniref:Disease resistance protein winged helix domain-containing protein n=1 Tax=Panicum virgatum TaxID=38727 RepID=A0A8T0WH00_PANVG|nr:hypothetical protein PVAP13_2KG276701 [Panicum virgatum]